MGQPLESLSVHKKHLGMIRRCKREKDFAALLKEIEPKLARQYAYRLLAKRAYLTAEIKVRLLTRLALKSI